MTAAVSSCKVRYMVEATLILILSLALCVYYLKIIERLLILKKIVSNATTELLIVDPYVNSILWTLVRKTPPSVRVRVLTDRMTADFLSAAKKFAAQHGNWVEIRRTEKYHDRFIVLDGNTCWHLGASITDARKINPRYRPPFPVLGPLARGLLLTLWPLPLPCTVSQFERQELVTAVTADIENVWASSASLLI